MAMPDSTDDWALLEQSSSDRDALSLLFSRHRDYVFRICLSVCGNRQQAEDLTQDIFVALPQSSAQPNAKFRTWLFTVAHNRALDLKRKQNRRRRLRMLLPWGEHQTVSDWHADMAAVFRLVGDLPVRQQQVLMLRYFEETNTIETAQALGISTGSVKTHLSRALATLRSRMHLGADLTTEKLSIKGEPS